MTTYPFNSKDIDMTPVLAHELARTYMRERQQESAALQRAARLRSARRWQRRAEQATGRAQLARLAVR